VYKWVPAKINVWDNSTMNSGVFHRRGGWGVAYCCIETGTEHQPEGPLGSNARFTLFSELCCGENDCLLS